MPDIGVVVALPGEAATLGARRARAAQRGRMRIVVAGIGAERAHAAARHLLDTGVSALISWGVAGGLAASLQPGDLLLAEHVCGPNGVVNVDTAWRGHCAHVLHAAGLDAATGTLWSAPVAVTSVIDKQALAAHGYMAVDMEGAAVAQVAQGAGVPFLALKGICDPAHRALPAAAANWLRADGHVRPMTLALALAREPRLWLALPSMRSDFHAACVSLRRAAAVLSPAWPS